MTEKKKSISTSEAFMKALKEGKSPVSKTAEDSKKVNWCIQQIHRIDSQYSDVKENNIKAFDHYFGVNYMKDIEGRSQVYTSDLADTIEWIMPSLMRIFAGGDDVTSLTPRRKQDTQQAENHNELVNYQIKVKNNWFIILNDWFRDALLLKRGVVKYQWWEDKEETETEHKGLTEEELFTLASDPAATKVEVSAERELQAASMVGLPDPETGMIFPISVPAVKEYDATVTYEYEEEYPRIDAVPVEEIGFPVDARDIDDMPFFYHRVKYDKWQFINKYGEAAFKEVEGIKNTFIDTADDLSVDQQRFVDINGVAMKFFYDINNDKWLVYECFFPNKDTGKPWFRSICGSSLLEDKKNKYKKPPFQVLTPTKLSHRIVGMSLYDMLKDLQKIRTTLIRQMLDTGYQNLNGRWVIDPTRVSFEDFLNSNRPGGVIRTLDGHPANEDAIMQIQGQGMPSFSFELFETVTKERDYHTGLMRGFTGLSSQQLNKTMRGQNQQVQMAQQRIEMMARLFAEMGIAPLIRDVVDMNRWFLKKEQAIKVVNNWISVTPEDVVAKTDVIINVGLGTTSKDTLVAQNQQMIGLYLQLQPIFGPALNDKILHALKELVKAMGYRDTQNWIPGEEEINNAQIMQMLTANQMGQGTQKGQKPPAIAAQSAQPMNLPEQPDWNNGYFG